MGFFAPKPAEPEPVKPTIRTRAVLTKKASMRDSRKPQGAKLVRDVAQAFLSADRSGDHRLTIDEFEKAVPAQMKTGNTDDHLQKLFNVVDADGNGFGQALNLPRFRSAQIATPLGSGWQMTLGTRCPDTGIEWPRFDAQSASV